MSEEEKKKPQADLTDEERAILLEVINAGDKGILPEEIAKKLNLTVEKVEEILEKFEEDGWFYSEEDEK